MQKEELSEVLITKAITTSFFQDFNACLSLDVAVAGAGPAGLTAARSLARAGYKVAVFERNLYIGGGIWGGGMLFPRLVFQREVKQILEEVGLELESTAPGYYVADAVEAAVKFAAAAIDAGAKIWVGVTVEDVVIRENDRIAGVVLNWEAVGRAGFHVDPLALEAKVVIDATGHPAELTRQILAKIPGAKVATPGGKVLGEKPMWAAKGEKALLVNTQEVYPGLIVAGMAANAVYGSPRMGAIFGGMLLSGEKAAEITQQLLQEKR